MTELSRCFVFTDREIEITIHNPVKNKNRKTICFLFLLCLFDVLLHNALRKTGWSAAKNYLLPTFPWPWWKISQDQGKEWQRMIQSVAY